MDDNLMHISQMILIGSTGRNIGKTMLASELIQHYKRCGSVVIGLKITTVQEKNGKCPRGGAGCGVCSSIKGNFEIVEETRSNLNKDTSILLASGAEKVYWIKTLKEYSHEAIKYFMTKVSSDNLIICESNSLRKVAIPGIFIMLNKVGNTIVKKSASEVINMADVCVDIRQSNTIKDLIKKIEVNKIGSNLTINVKSKYNC